MAEDADHRFAAEVARRVESLLGRTAARVDPIPAGLGLRRFAERIRRGGVAPERLYGLLDTRELERVVVRTVPWRSLRSNVRSGRVHAVCVAATEIATGRVVVFIADIFWAFFCLLMLRVSWDYLAVFWRFKEYSPSLGIDQFYPQTILVIGYALMLIRLIQTYFTWWREGRTGLPGMLEEEWEATSKDQEHQL